MSKLARYKKTRFVFCFYRTFNIFFLNFLLSGKNKREERDLNRDSLRRDTDLANQRFKHSDHLPLEMSTERLELSPRDPGLVF